MTLQELELFITSYNLSIGSGESGAFNLKRIGNNWK